MEDDVMARVTAAVQRGQGGEREAARRELESVWDGDDGPVDDFHRCVIAHFLADLQDDTRDELRWDERALAAVDGITDERAQEFDTALRVRGFLPSLLGSLADDHRRLGDAERARGFLDQARAASDALGDDACGDLVRGILDRVGRALDERSTAPLTAPEVDVLDADLPVRLPVLALVTSAGGLAALTAVLAGLPADLPAAVLVVQHQDPERRPPDALAALLDGRTPLSVRVARDGDRLEPGVVLVAPPATHMIVTSTSAIGLIETGPLPPARPSADLLLATLAVTCGPRSLAVVLTGKGHDAQAGIRAMHRCGATVLAQDEATAEHFGMPGSAIATGLVQAVYPLDGLAAAIVEHLDRAVAFTAGYGTAG